MPVHDHQPGVCAMAERLLGNQVSRYFVVEWEGAGGRHDRLNRRIATAGTLPLRRMCLTVHCQPGIIFKSRFIAPKNPTADLCLEIQRRYCTSDQKPLGKTPIDVPDETVNFHVRGLICWSLTQAVDLIGVAVPPALRRDVLLESWATASPPTGSHHRRLVSDGLGAWTLRAAVGGLGAPRGALPPGVANPHGIWTCWGLGASLSRPLLACE